MKTKFLTSVMLISLISIMTVMAQEREKPLQQKKKQLEIQKIGYFTEHMSLTAEEAQAFWPVYNDFQKKREELAAEFRKLKKSPATELDNLSEKELNALADSEIEHAKKMLELRVQLHENVKKVLPLKKVILLYEAEKDFKKHLLKDLKVEQNKARGKHQQQQKQQ
ncbi:MAG: hypothetical protein BWY70_00881 [Bacteroidetes bacterium ADurb.Bin408]|nr:MAG: hypothetical protein BWY70_00881 [Bacteroidetes bacterium ADurb.Bin408]